MELGTGPKWLIGVGVSLTLLGLLWAFAPAVFGKIGRLPGDIAIERENVRFYFPITTSILVSAILSFIAYLARR